MLNCRSVNPKLIAGCLLLLFFFRISEVCSQSSQVQLITHSSVDTSSLDKDQVRRIFTMYQTNWSDSQPIVVFVLASHNTTHQFFSREVLGLFPYQLDRIWNKLIYSGLGEGPTKVYSEEEMLEKIKQQPGSIGYVMTLAVPSDINIVQLAEE